MPLYYRGKRIREYGASGLYLTANLTPNNFEVNGSPTINGNNVKGFSNANFLKIPPFTPEAYPWEIKVRFSFELGNLNQDQYIFGAAENYKSVKLAILNRKIALFVSSNGISWDLVNAKGKTGMDPYNVYDVIVKYTGLRYTVQMKKTADKDFKEEIAVENTISLYKINTPQTWIGNDGQASDTYFRAQIYLGKTEINVNGSPFWRNKKTEIVSKPIGQAYLNGQKVFDVQAYAPSYVIGEVAKPSVQQIFNGVMTKPGVIQIHCIGGGNPTTWSFYGTNFSGSAAGYVGDAYIYKPCNIRMVVGAREQASMFQISDLTTPDNWLTVIQCNSGYSASASGGGRGADAPILNGHGYVELLQPPALNRGGNGGDSSGSHHGASVWGGYGTGSVNGYGKLQYLRKYR